ncbi:MAG: DUF1015 domain-containing protein [Planctomycetes bacterium]|nr:DUF1015 domain-containing protein [Planctomycetota bacterium]
MNEILESIGLNVPVILLPREGVDLTKWAVVACDQYTSQPEYWEKVSGLVDGAPSTLHMILPEVYLETEKEGEIVKNTNEAMLRYVEDGTLVEGEKGFILVDRKTSHAESRKGLVVALDLEKYDYSDGSTSLIRATEGTIVDRLPPRIKVRENASVELPHIMVLIDDPDRTVIEPLFEDKLETAYDFSLMMDSGRIKGYRVSGPELIGKVAGAVARLADPDVFNAKYGLTDEAVLLYAMGDGNHSFATAKEIWKKIKADAEDKEAVMSHPARYALVELVNIHDAGLQFEPIHRVLFSVDQKQFFTEAQEFFEGCGSEFSVEAFESPGKAQETADAVAGEGGHAIPFVSASGAGLIKIMNPKLNLVVATLQSFLDDFMTRHRKTDIDYIHGEDVVCELGMKDGNMGFYLPAINKDELFKTIILDGSLPRKTFSMGEADEKRFYLECRKIR